MAAIEIGTDGPTLGVLGGGQLGRMLCEAAAPLGVDVVVADPTPDPPAAPVAREALVGGLDDPATIRAVAERVDCLTLEIELVDPDALAGVADEVGVPVHPSPETLRMAQDKLLEKRTLAEADIPVADFRAVDGLDDLEAAAAEFGYPVMLKARHGGYDGRGNFLVEDDEAAAAAADAVPGPAIAERVIDFDRELSVIGVEGIEETRQFPVVENRHAAEILRETVAPARTAEAVADEARTVVDSVLDVLEGRGVYGIELFEVDGDVLVNEIAPRPHNSGHYTIEGAVTSQFAQHVRAVLGWPLGSTRLRDPTVTANVLGDDGPARPARLMGAERVLAAPGAALHWYGKREVRPLRKMGHVTCVPTAGEGREALLETARNLVDGLGFVDSTGA